MTQNGDVLKAEAVDTALDDMSIEELRGERSEESSRDTMAVHDVADQPETCELASEGGCGRCNYCKARGLDLGPNDLNGQFEGTSTNTMSGSTFDDRLHTPGDSTKSSPNTPNMSTSETSKRSPSNSRSPKLEDDEHEDIVGGDITVKLENGKPLKLSRKPSQKIIARLPPLFTDLSDSTEEAMTQFQVIRDCIYGSKYMGSSEHDALGCDCSEEWRGDMNHACGEDSDCINRATKMECMDDECNCGAGCQNQRFQRKQYANVSVIKTEKKGYGLRADSDLQANDFIFEYIGEVINEPVFRRRTIQYDEEGIKHFYFMSLTKSEFVDATKKGNLGRFCNHSCNPNCYVDKWVVGNKLRMGIFAERNIKAGEELVFNYNVDRYGADPQPCYCGEPNCTGFIGGKTQTERATKLSHTTIEALGIDDGDGWDTAVAKKPRKKKTGEDDEEYVSSIQPKGLEEDGVTKVMATLMQCKEKWIAVKVLDRLQRCDDERVRNRVVRMHGYQILGTTLKTWIVDNNVILQVLDVLYKLPRLTRNKISDSKIEATVETLTTSEHEDVAFESKRLLDEWSKLEVAYRIPRKKFDPNSQPIFERRASGREDEGREASTTAPAVVTPTGPRSNVPQRSSYFTPSRPPMMRRQQRPLPSGWFATLDKSGNTYYYNEAGVTTWQRPTIPAVKPPAPKGPTKATQSAKAIQDIIDSLTKAEPTSSARTSSTPQPEPIKEKKSTEKWRSLPIEKQMKLYENTLFPHIKYVMDKFKNKLPRDDLKKFAKEISKKIVNSDFKNNRVQDPTKISEKQEHKVKKHVKEFFIKVVAKKVEHDKKRAARKAQEGSADTPSTTTEAKGEEDGDIKGEDSDMEMFDEGEKSPIETPSDEGLKRKREGEIDETDVDTPNKRIKESASPEPPPPPPPPPPAEDLQDALKRDDEDFAKQEAELMRENEEALRKENEDAMREAQMMHTTDESLPGSIDAVDMELRLNGQGVKYEGMQVNGAVAHINGHGHKNGALEN